MEQRGPRPREAAADHEQEAGAVDYKQMRDDLLYIHHEDRGGSTDKMREILEAYQAAVQGDGEALEALYQQEVIEREEDPNEALREIRGALFFLREHIGAFVQGDEIKKSANAEVPDSERQVALLKEIQSQLSLVRGALRALERMGVYSEEEVRAQTEELEQELAGLLDEMLEDVQDIALEDAEDVHEPYRQLLARIEQCIHLVENRYIALLVKLRHEAEQKDELDESARDEKKETEEEEEDTVSQQEYEDDYFEDEEVQTVLRQTWTRIPVVAQEDVDGEDMQELVALETWQPEDQESLHGMEALVITESLSEANRLGQMMNKGFMRGSISQNGGLYEVRVTEQVLDWCADPQEEFFLKNTRRAGWNPTFFDRIKNPKTGTFFPKEIFLDETGVALQLFLKGRLDEFPSTDEAEALYKKVA